MQPRFRILRTVAHGGQGRVMAVEDAARGDSLLALKEPHRGQIDALRQEFGFLSRLRHPHLASVYDWFEESPLGSGGVPAYTQAWVEGVPLWLALSDAPEDARVEVFTQVMQALAYLHALSIVHLDLKPANVLVSTGARPRACVLDFGIAATAGGAEDTVRGSLGYLAPERFDGTPVDGRSDLYALGAMMAEVWTGQPPSQRVQRTDGRTVKARCESLRAEGLPEHCAALVAQLLSPNPEDRPPTVAHAAEVWGRALGRSVPLHTAGTIQAILRAGPPVGRSTLMARGLDDVIARGAVVFHGVSGSGRRTVARGLMGELQAAGHRVERWPGAPEQAGVDGFCLAVVRLLGRALDAQWLASVEPGEDLAAYQRALSHEADKALSHLTGPPLSPRRPVLVVETPETAPPVVNALLEAMVRRSEQGRACVLGLVLVSREWAGPAGVALPPLDRKAVEAFVAARLGAGDVATELGGSLTAASGGRALHLETLVGLLVARDELRFGRDGWTWHGDATAIVLPEAMDDAAAERVALLSAPLRDVLGALHWLRFPSPARVVEAAVGGESAPGAFLSQLLELASAGMVECDAHGRWFIGHEVVGQAAQGWVPHGGEEAAHARVLALGMVQGLAEALHTGGGAGAAMAVAHGEIGWREGRLVEASAALDLALDLAPDHPDALMRRADVANLLGPRELQVTCLERLMRETEAGTHTRLLVGAKLLWARTRTGEVEETQAIAEEVLALARRLDAVDTEAAVLVHMAIVRTQAGAYDTAETLLHEAAVLAKGLASQGLQARIANNLGNILAYRDRPEDALARYQEAYRLKEEEGDPVGCRIALGNVGLMSLQLGRWEEALASFQASHARAVETGHRRGEAWSLVGLAIVGLEGGAFGYAERRARRAREIADTLGDGLVGCDALTTLAEVALARGDAGSAQGRAHEAWTIACELKSGYSRAWSGAALASAWLEAEPERALERAEQARSEQGADARARMRALGVSAEAAVRLGDLTRAEAAIREGLAMEYRARTPSFVAQALRVFRLVGAGSDEAALTQWASAQLPRWREAWPAEAWDDGLDAQGCFDGPSRGTFLALLGGLGLEHTAAVDAEQVAHHAVRMEDMMDMDWAVAASAGTPRDWGRALGDVLARLVSEVGAERAFLVDGEGCVMAARDADGEAISDPGKKLPEAAVEEARASSATWRAAGAKGGAVLASPLPGPTGQASNVLVIQNRFSASAFDGLDVPAATASALGTLCRLRALHAEADQARSALEEVRTRQAGERTRSTQEILRLRQELEATREQLGPRHAYPKMIYTSTVMKRMLRKLDRVIDTELPVYVHGESGTGKELVAQAVHRQGARASGPFVAQNCSAIPAHLFESEFFGHAKGAFTGADRASEGLFRRADGGTLFLDEIGDLPLELQAKLLRVIETREVRPVGGAQAHLVDVRVVCATHRDLAECVEKGTFREDLYYRLNVVRIDIPPLRDRPDDVPLLVDHFLGLRAPGRDVTLEEGVMRAFMNYDWPGNVRQLENEVSRALVLSEEQIEVRHLSPEVASGSSGVGTRAGGGGDLLRMLGVDRGTLRERVDRLEYLLLKAALETSSGNKSEVSRAMGLSRAGLNMKLKRLGLWEQ